ncbi:MAG: DUF1156 domain-containing protein, partial [Planctomycetales bacterium]|nr:DUF1156 domain-containing protein [Planctomycetales bacterium]
MALPLDAINREAAREKSIRHGHPSTLHLWWARRPLAACRAVVCASLWPDPADGNCPLIDPEIEATERAKLFDLIEELVKWENRNNPRVINAARLEIARSIAANKVADKELKDDTPLVANAPSLPEEQAKYLPKPPKEYTAHDLRFKMPSLTPEQVNHFLAHYAPPVLDPFAGGGAIPLEAMRLGCETTAVDINPVAWFILKCTLEYPQKLAGQTRLLPEFILHNDTFMAEFFKKAKGYGKAETRAALKRLHDRFKKKPKRKAKDDQISFQFQQEPDEADNELQADLAWHVPAWGQWVLDRARRELAQYYPTYADFEPIKKDEIAYEHQPMRLVPLKGDGTPDIDSFNDEFTQEYLDDKRNPRWVAKPTVAYLWARTVPCKNCRATIPLLKTRWLCKKSNNRVLLTMEPNAEKSGVTFGVQYNVPVVGGNTAQRREHDKRIGAGTMSRAGADCPCCGLKTIMTMEDIRVVGQVSELG